MVFISCKIKNNIQMQWGGNCKLQDRQTIDRSKKLGVLALFAHLPGGGLPYETDGDARRLA